MPVLNIATSVHWRAKMCKRVLELLLRESKAFADVGLAQVGIGNEVRITLRSTSCARSWLSSMPSSRDASLGREILEYSLAGLSGWADVYARTPGRQNTSTGA